MRVCEKASSFRKPEGILELTACSRARLRNNRFPSAGAASVSLGARAWHGRCEEINGTEGRWDEACRWGGWCATCSARLGSFRLGSSETGVGRSTDTAGLGTCTTRAVVALRSEITRWTSVPDVVAQTPTSANLCFRHPVAIKNRGCRTYGPRRELPGRGER